MKEKKGNKLIFTALIVIFLGIFAFAGYKIFSQSQMYSEAEKEYTNLANDYTQNGEGWEKDIDFRELKKLNSDIIGWIEIPGTVINYPVLKTDDNIKYLNYTYMNEPSGVGAIFIDYLNNSDFTDNNTIIYGHNMRDGSMFGSLSNFSDQEYYDNHKKLYIYTPERKIECKIFSAYSTTDSSYTYTLPNNEDMKKYIDFAMENNSIKADVKKKSIDKVFTLSTCHSSSDDARMVVHASVQSELVKK